MEVGKLTVEVRNKSGKNEAKRLRASGKVPGVCYGPGIEPIMIALDPKALKKSLDPEKRQNTVIRATMTGGEGADRTVTVMLKDFQTDAIRRDVQHVDLILIDENKEVVVTVPVILTGKAVGVVDGGQLHAVYRALPVKCKPADIPTKIEADVTPLHIGEALHVKDLKLPAGVKAALDGGQTIASVVAPEVEKVAEPTEAEVAAAAAAPAAGAPAAAGAAPAKDAKAGDAKAAPEKKEGKK